MIKELEKLIATYNSTDDISIWRRDASNWTAAHAQELVDRFRRMEAALREAVRIASDENHEQFKGDLRARESALIAWKRSAREALSPGKNGGSGG